jgi:hypothetical protein
MNIFQNIKWQQNIDYDANFNSFPTAMLLLFRLVLWFSANLCCVLQLQWVSSFSIIRTDFWVHAMVIYFTRPGFWDEGCEMCLKPHSSCFLYRMQSGENWNYVMTDCMVLQSCIQISENVHITYPGSNTSTLIYSGPFYDSVSDAQTLSLIPSSAQASAHHLSRKASTILECRMSVYGLSNCTVTSVYVWPEHL